MNKPRRAKARRLLPLPLDSSETKCGICLDEVVKRGKIGPCSHLYCFTCLLEWSKLNNTCPQCKVTFRCVTRVDFKTDTFESKVFIKDKTLPTGHISSDEDIEHIDSSEIEDSDPDFIDDTNASQNNSDNEIEAQFTQRMSKRKRTVFSSTNVPSLRSKRKSRVILSDESDNENGVIHKNIIDNCKSPDLFDKSPSRAGRAPSVNCSFVPPSRKRTTEPASPLGTHSSGSVVSPLGTHTSPFRTRLSPNSRDRTRSVYFTSPKYNKGARWATLDKHVRNNKKRRKATKKAPKRPGIAIPTLSTSTSPGNNTSTWLTTRHKSPSKSDKENSSPTFNKRFKSPFKKAQSPNSNQLDDPEQYFASIIDADEFN